MTHDDVHACTCPSQVHSELTRLEPQLLTIDELFARDED